MADLPIKHVFLSHQNDSFTDKTRVFSSASDALGDPQKYPGAPQAAKGLKPGKKTPPGGLISTPCQNLEIWGFPWGSPRGGSPGTPPRGPKSVQVRIQNAVLPIKHVYSGHPERSFTDKTPVLPIKHVF